MVDYSIRIIAPFDKGECDDTDNSTKQKQRIHPIHPPFTLKLKPAILYHNIANRQCGFAAKIKLFFHVIQLVHNLLDFSNQSAVDTVWCTLELHQAGEIIRRRPELIMYRVKQEQAVHVSIDTSCFNENLTILSTGTPGVTHRVNPHTFVPKVD